MEAIHTEEYKGFTIEIIPDDCAESPRDWDNLGTMVCWHSRYNLGDKHNYSDPTAFRFALVEEILGDTDKAEAYVENHNDEEIMSLIDKHYFIKTLWLYDHSGISMSTSSFIGRAQHASWDSGRVGYIYVSKNAVKKEWKVTRISPKLEQTIEKNLDGEVETYDSYLRGDVYGYKIKNNAEDDDDLESCWGFIGDYDGYVLEEAKRQVDYLAEQVKKEIPALLN